MTSIASNRGGTRVLLTYGWVRSSYAALRSLSSKGIDVWVADSHRVGMCQWSNRRRGFRKYSSPFVDEGAFIDSIVSICGELGISVIFPSHNETEILARHRHRLPAGTDVLLPDAASCALFNNKAQAHALAESVGLRVPRRVRCASVAEVPAAFRHLDRGGGVVMKLLTGHSSKGVFYPRNASEAQATFERLVSEFGLSPERYPQMEERVSGFGVGCSVAYWKGRPIASICHRRLREKVSTGGTSTLRECISDPALSRSAGDLFEAIRWHGLAMAEFKVCERTGVAWFIEVNPRMWGSIPMAIEAGIDFPYLMWLASVEGYERAIAYAAASPPKIGFRGRWLLGDALFACSELMHLRPLCALDALSSTHSDSFDDLYFDDLGAFAGEVAHYATRFLATRSLNPGDKGTVR
jgi:predicted ATP-grasp superfamily ATP-dependent carboligase